MASYYGASQYDGIASFHKVTIMDPVNDVVVTGYLGEGTSKEIVSNWTMPFSEAALQSRFQLVSGAIQKLTDTALTGVINTIQVWAGNQPYTFNLAVKFRAFNDPAIEVDGAIAALETMMAPNPKTAWMSMSIPSYVTINFGRLQTFPGCVIKSMQASYDKERHTSGYLLRADVSLQVETGRMVTRDDILHSYTGLARSI